MNATRIKDIIEKWNGFLSLESAFADLLPIALCLDAQSRFNESHDNAYFKRFSVPLVIRVFRESKAYKKNHIANFEEGVKPEIHLFKTKFQPPHVGGHCSLDDQVKYIEQLSTAITKEFDALFNDMANESITFHHFGCLNDGTLTLAFSR